MDLKDIKIGARSEFDTEMATCEKHNTKLVINYNNQRASRDAKQRASRSVSSIVICHDNNNIIYYNMCLTTLLLLSVDCGQRPIFGVRFVGR